MQRFWQRENKYWPLYRAFLIPLWIYIGWGAVKRNDFFIFGLAVLGVTANIGYALRGK